MTEARSKFKPYMLNVSKVHLEAAQFSFINSFLKDKKVLHEWNLDGNVFYSLI